MIAIQVYGLAISRAGGRSDGSECEHLLLLQRDHVAAQIVHKSSSRGSSVDCALQGHYTLDVYACMQTQTLIQAKS